MGRTPEKDNAQSLQVADSPGGGSNKSKKSLFTNLVFESKENDLTELGSRNLSAIRFDGRNKLSPEMHSKVASSPTIFEGFSAVNPLSSGKQRRNRLPVASPPAKPHPTKLRFESSGADGTEEQVVHVEVFAPNVSRGTEDTIDTDSDADAVDVDGVASTSMRHFSMEAPKKPVQEASRKAYLTAPCDGTRTLLTIHRHQANGLLELFMETKHTTLFLAAAYKRRGSYTLFQDRGETDVHSPSYLGKVVTNYPNRTDYMLEEWCEDGTCRQTAGVFFKKRFSATGVPRRLTAIVPDRTGADWRRWDGDNLLSLYRSSKKEGVPLRGVHTLKNAMPVWDNDAKGYVLDMSQRIRLPSVKNFQMKGCKAGCKEPEGPVVLEFGKSTPTTFALECRAPLSILQALTVAISMVDSSLLVTM